MDLYTPARSASRPLYSRERHRSSFSPAGKMRQRSNSAGDQRPSTTPKKTSTYLARIAMVLHDSPGGMLTFAGLMEKLDTSLNVDRKATENIVRVCLSTNRCFVKVPVTPGSVESKRNYWKFESSEITAKMARRHFKGMLPYFPELASRLEAEKTAGRPQQQPAAAARAPQPAAAAAVAPRFDGPFSIASLLRSDVPVRPPAAPNIQEPLPVYACATTAQWREYWKSLPGPMMFQSSSVAHMYPYRGLVPPPMSTGVYPAQYFADAGGSYTTLHAAPHGGRYGLLWR